MTSTTRKVIALTVTTHSTSNDYRMDLETRATIVVILFKVTPFSSACFYRHFVIITVLPEAVLQSRKPTSCPGSPEYSTYHMPYRM